jgi:PAS domain S-box-containing protein
MAEPLPPASREEIDALALELAGVLTHYRVTAGRPLFHFLATDPYPGILRIAQVMVRGALDPSTSHTAAVNDCFAELGAVANRASLDPGDLMNVCGRAIHAAERHVGRAHPEVLSHDDWVRHWSNVGQVASRAAMFGHRRPGFRSDAEWASLLDDPSLPRIVGMRGVAAAEPDASAVATVRAVSGRLDYGADAVIATDTSGTILSWSRVATRLYGWESAEVMGRSVVDVTPVSQARREAEAILRRVLSGRPWSGSFNLRDKGGALLRAWVTDIPIERDSRVVGIVGLSTPA